MDAEQRVATQHFNVTVLEIEGVVGGYGRRVERGPIIRSIRDRGANGRLAIRGICNREVGQTGDADGWRLSDGSDGNYLILEW